MRRWLWVVLGVAIIAGAAFGVARWRVSRATANRLYDGKTLAEWVERLDAVEVPEAMEALRSQGEAALPVLLEARKSPNLRVHRRAIELLIALGTPSVQPLVELLPHAGARVELALVRLGPKAVPGLEKALGGKDGAAAARVLGLIGARATEAVPALVGLVQDGGVDKAARVAAVDALGRIGAELGPEVLTREGDPIVRAMTFALASDDLALPAARAMAGYGRAAKPAIPELARLAKDKRPDLSDAACQALGATLDPSASVPLVSQLGREDRAAQAAALALARLGPAAKPALPGLIAALKKGKEVARLAQAVLERLGESAVPSLIDALESDDDAIRLGAAEGLALLGPRAEGAAKALAARLADKKPAVALTAAQALVRVDLPGSAVVVAPLGKLLASDAKEIAGGAALVLVQLGSIAKPLVPELLTMLAGKDETKAALAADLLGGIKPATKEVLLALGAGLRGPPLVQTACIESLGRHGDASKEAIPALRKCLDDSTLRPKAALALVRISRDESALAVEKLAPDISSREVPALAALATMGPPPAEALPTLRPLLGDARVGGRALLALSRMDRDVRILAVPDLLTVLGSDIVVLQMRAAEMLTEMGAPAAPGLAQALKSPSPRTRVGAMMALRSDKFRDAVKDRTPLLDALEGEDSVLREHAGETLAVLGVSSEEDDRRVTELLGRPEADLRRFAVRILLAGVSKADQPLDPKLAECLFDPDEAVRLNVCLSRVPTRSPLFPVVAAEDSSSYVRVAADLAAQKSPGFPSERERRESLQRLAGVVDPKALLEIANAIDERDMHSVGLLREPLEQTTRGDDLSDRINAFVALGRLDKPSALAEMVDDMMRNTKFLPLGRSYEPSAPRCERFLQSILMGWDAHARIEAALAFRQPSPASVAILRHRREVEREPDVRAAIDRALERSKP
jgi:HEAT repeat protein